MKSFIPRKKIIYTASTAGLLAALLCSMVFSCTHEADSYVYHNLGELEKEQRVLFGLLKTSTNEKTRFSIAKNMSANLRASDNDIALIAFLSDYVEPHSANNYAPYWLALLAQTYLKKDMPKMAVHYLERVLASPDLEIQGQSLHLSALNTLVRISDNPQAQVRYYTLLIKQFSDKTDLAKAYFMRAQACEKLGDWALAIDDYTKFIQFDKFDLIVPGIPDSYSYARRIVDYNASPKNWTFDTLDELVTAVTRAIRAQDYYSLERYRSKVNFFAMSWKQELSQIHAPPDFNLKDFMYGRYISIASSVDPSSTPYEAFLRTSGWNQYVSTWYLCFKKINFPASPAIHGKWEWAGIYYGERL